jgi:transposase InsO family protein
MMTMDEDRRKQIALFKYGLIAPVLSGNINLKMQYFREAAKKEYDVPYIGKRKYKARTFKSWLRRYRIGGFDALMPKKRGDKGQSRKIDDDLAACIKEAVLKFPVVSCAAIYRMMVAEGKIRPDGVTEATVRNYINDNQLKQKRVAEPRKKFEKENLNDLWIADCMHGPYIAYGKKKHKVFLIAAIDDFTRMITARGWFFHENSICLECVLKDAIRRFGLPRALYCDNGSLFSTSHLQLACARLGIALIHSKPYDSPSRGKIERFFRTVRQKFLSFLDVKEIVDLDQLNERFERWLDKEYHKHFHHGIGTTPMERFSQGLKNTSIKRVSEPELDRAFQITIYRKVKNDSTVSVNKILYECSPKFIGKKIQIRYPSDKAADLTIYENDTPVEKLKKLDIHDNASVPAWGITFSKEDQDD